MPGSAPASSRPCPRTPRSWPGPATTRPTTRDRVRGTRDARSPLAGRHSFGCALACALLVACSHPGRAAAGTGLLARVADVPLPGGATRFDYQEIDTGKGLLVLAHMRDDSVLLLDLADGSVRKELTGIPTPRGVAVAANAGSSS
jgi:hypothetical protein